MPENSAAYRAWPGRTASSVWGTQRDTPPRVCGDSAGRVCHLERYPTLPRFVQIPVLIRAPMGRDDATIITLDTGELLAEYTLDPTKNYQRKNG